MIPTAPSQIDLLTRSLPTQDEKPVWMLVPACVAYVDTFKSVPIKKTVPVDMSWAGRFPSIIEAESHKTRQATQTRQDTRWGDRTSQEGFLWEVKAAEDTSPNSRIKLEDSIFPQSH